MKFLTKIIVRILIILQCTLFSSSLFSQTDYEFWFAAPEISYAVTAPPSFDTVGIDRPIVLVISTCDGPAIVRISQPADPNFQVLIDTLQTNELHQIDLTPFIDMIESKPANTILNTGLLITSNKPINANYEIQNRINSESYTLKGKNALGTEFLIPSQNQYSNYPYCDPPARNSISVVASEDETTVKIVPSQFMEGQPGLDTIFVLLNRGQTWYGRSFSADSNKHLGGTFVFANKPIAVTVTDDAVRPNIATGLSIDIAGDQLISRHLMSNEYLAFPVDYWSGYLSMLYIYAFENGTSVSVDGSGIGSLNRGEVIKHVIGESSCSPAYVQSNKSVEVYMFYKARPGSGSSEVAAAICAPLACAGSYQITFTKTGPNSISDYYLIRLLSKTADCGNFTCSDPSIQSSLVPANFISLPFTGNLWGFFGMEVGFGPLTFSNSTGNFQATTMNELTMGALRANNYTGYSGLNLGPDRVLCPGDTILLDAGSGNYQYIWSTGATSRTIDVTTAGTYWVQKTSASCTLSDTIVITNLTYTPVNLGTDTSLCFGDSLKLDAGSGKSWYQWSTGQTTRFIYIHDSGTYWVTVPVSPCNFTDSDTIHVSVLSPINLGPDRSICQGDSVLLDAGAGLSSYLWNTGSTTRTIWAKSAGQYWVLGHSGNCSSTDSVIITLRPLPIVNLGPDMALCQGDSAIFDAGFCEGCIYSWSEITLAQSNIGNGQTYKTGTAGTYMVMVTDSTGCRNSDTIQLAVNPVNPVGLTINSSGNPTCAGLQVNFTATAVNGGSSPSYQWTVNGTNAGTNSPNFSFVPNNGDIVVCILISNALCSTGNPATSNPVVMIVNPGLPVNISISASSNPFCQGASVTFTASPTNGGANPSYQWKMNGVNVGLNNPVYSYMPANGDIVSCDLNSSVTCPIGNPATSNQITMIENTSIPVGLTINSSANPVCQGTSVTYLAIPVNGGSMPVYQWKVNGLNIGTNNASFSYNPTNGDVVTCVLTSNILCASGNPAISNAITMTVNPNLPVSVSISPSANTVCAGTSVAFSAIPTNPGANPVYQWKVNGNNVGVNLPLYTYTPVNGDIVTCRLTSDVNCPTGNPATSNSVFMTVNPNLPVNVSIVSSGNPVCAGTSVTFTAIPINGGTPVYQWQVNGVNAGTNNSTLTYIPSNGDNIVCTITSNLPCTSNNPATSTQYQMVFSQPPVVTFTACFDTITTINAKPIKLKGGIPLGGTYSGPGVNSTTGVFTPSATGVGIKTITYTYTNSALCSDAGYLMLDVRAVPSFTCGNLLTDIRDGKVYPTVQIGSQCWMAANLNYGTMILASLHQRDNCLPEKYCFNDLTANCELGTANYQWDELMQYDDTPGLKGLCPPGWHIPTENDWNTLFANYINNAFAGSPLKYSGYSGFNALLSGVRHMNVQWDYQNLATFFWSSTPYGANKAWAHGINDYDPSVSVYPSLRSNAFSVRCLKD